MSETSERKNEWEEKCQRCGFYGDDRRTLWMSCLYAMEELGIPFEQVKVMGKAYPKVGEEELNLLGRKEGSNYPKITAPKFATEPSSEVERGFYTLRVCKDCRSDWMAAIKHWFNVVEAKKSVGSGIFVREYGAIREVTTDEWAAMSNKPAPALPPPKSKRRKAAKP